MEIQERMENQGQEVYQAPREKMVHLVHKDPRVQEVCQELKDPKVTLVQLASLEMLVVLDHQVPKVWMDCQVSMETQDRWAPLVKMDPQEKLVCKVYQENRDHQDLQAFKDLPDLLVQKVTQVLLVLKVHQEVQED